MQSIPRHLLIWLMALAASATSVPLMTIPATPDAMCYLSNGDLIYSGQKKVFQLYASCRIYECTAENGLVIFVGDCPPPMCVDAAYYSSDECCRECPNGQNCRLPNGEILTGTEERKIGEMSCKCPNEDAGLGPQEERHIRAVCEPLPTLKSTIFNFTRTTIHH